MGEEGYPEDYPLPRHWGQRQQRLKKLTTEERIGKAFRPSIDPQQFRAQINAAFGHAVDTVKTMNDHNIAHRKVNQMINDATRGHGSPEDMEAAALRLATLAQEIRAFLELEPQGEEPVISWKHQFSELDTVY